jgi:hypothetical protein
MGCLILVSTKDIENSSGARVLVFTGSCQKSADIRQNSSKKKIQDLINIE